MQATMKSKSKEFERGYIDGVCQQALAHLLRKARGQALTKPELTKATAVLRDMPLSEIARRIHAVKPMPTGALRFGAILGTTTKKGL